jgi:hypothetical protein
VASIAAGKAGRGLAAVLVAACLVSASAAAGVVTGVSDQRAAFFDSPAYRALELGTVRLIVPWDAGLRAGPWDAWIARARRDGAAVMVALEHDGASRCPASPCVLPSTKAYGDALSALLAKYPSIHEVTAWNEPNHSSQPTFRHPEAAAHYYDEARARCRACTIVAGDVLDDVALANWLSAYKAALTSAPAVWGLHNYYDSTYFRSRGVMAMLAQTSGRLWLTETGGIVSFKPPGGPGLLYDEQRAADGVAWLYELADAHPEIERMYLYQWQGTQDNGFDSGLLGYDGLPRPAYGVVAGRVGPRGGAGGAAAAPPVPPPALDSARGAGPAAGAPPVPGAPGGRATLRPGRTLRLLHRGRLEVRVRCVVRGTSAGGCRRRLVVRVAGKVIARLAVDVAASRLFTRVVTLAPRARRHLLRARRPRVQLQTCAPAGRPCSERSDVAVSRTHARS